MYESLYLSLASGHGHVDESASVCYSLFRTTLGRLLLLLWLNLSSSTDQPCSILHLHNIAWESWFRLLYAALRSLSKIVVMEESVPLVSAT